MHVESLIDVLLSLRANALRSGKERDQRRAFVKALVKGDILSLKAGPTMVQDLFLIPSHPLKHALCALVSIIASTNEGVGYLTREGEDCTAIEKVLDVLKDQDEGSVTQRFCLAALQKASFRAASSGLYSKMLEQLITKKGLIEWLSKFLERSRLRSDMNPFTYEFASALLANLLSTAFALDHLSKNLKLAKDLLNIILNLIKDKLSPSVLWHLLLVLSHLSTNKERLAGPFEESYFSDKITDFQEFYSQVNPNGKNRIVISN